MSNANYIRIADDTEVNESELTATPAGRLWHLRWWHLVTAFALLLICFACISPRSEPAFYNPLPSPDDKSFNSTSLPVVMWHGIFAFAAPIEQPHLVPMTDQVQVQAYSLCNA